MHSITIELMNLPFRASDDFQLTVDTEHDCDALFYCLGI